MNPSLQRELAYLRVKQLVHEAERRSIHHRGRTTTRRPAPRAGSEER
jgi:hypothetical protein